MKKILFFMLSVWMVNSANASSIAVIDDYYGYTSPNVTSAANALEASTISNVSGATIGSQTAASLLASYDALVFSWAGSSFSSTFWSDTLLNYIQLGGGVIFDGAESSVNALNGSGITFFGSSTYGGGSQSVTDNTFITQASVDGVNHHLGGLSGNSDWNEFLSDGVTTLGMYATFGLGNIIVTSTDFFWHGDATDLEFFKDEIRFVTSPSAVPLPGAVWLFGSALMGLIGIRRKAKTSIA